MFVKWQIFGTAEVDDLDDFRDELYDAVEFVEGVQVSGLDYDVED